MRPHQCNAAAPNNCGGRSKKNGEEEATQRPLSLCLVLFAFWRGGENLVDKTDAKARSMV